MYFFFFFFLALPRGMCDLSSRTGDRTVPPAVGGQSLNHWTTREVPCGHVFLKSVLVSIKSLWYLDSTDYKRDVIVLFLNVYNYSMPEVKFFGTVKLMRKHFRYQLKVSEEVESSFLKNM